MFNICVTSYQGKHQLTGCSVKTKNEDGEDRFKWEIATGSMRGISGEARYEDPRQACNGLARYLRQPRDSALKTMMHYVPKKTFTSLKEVQKWLADVNENGLPEEEKEKNHRDTLRRSRVERKRKKRVSMKGSKTDREAPQTN